jgi:hypothetical protein
MRKIGVLGMLPILLATSSEHQELNSFIKRGSVSGGKKPIETDPFKPIPFTKEEGVLNMINDYKLIQKGESKKGKVKQKRILDKVNTWIEKGFLKHEDLI